MNWVQAGIRSGSPIDFGRQRLIPRSLVIEIRWPWGSGGFIYNHPIAISVQTGDGPFRVKPIIDVTLLAQICILIWAAFAARFLWRINHD